MEPSKMNVFLTSTALALTATVGFAQTWTPDPTHTEVRAYYNHAGFSEQSVEFREFEGALIFDPENVGAATAEFSIPVSSVSSGVEMFDDHLLGEALFDAANHPNLIFKSTSVEQTGDMTLKVTGDLSFRGRTNEVVFDVAVQNLGEHPVGPFFDFYKGTWLGFTAETTINRSEWGMDYLIPIGSDEVRIFISSEMKAAE
jgi:polyisoprenoid-binding protein YceI